MYIVLLRYIVGLSICYLYLFSHKKHFIEGHFEKTETILLLKVHLFCFLTFYEQIK